MTPDSKSDEGELRSEKVSKKLKFNEPSIVELSNKITEKLNTTQSESKHMPSSTSVASPIQVIELSDEPVVIEAKVSSPKLSLKRKNLELTRDKQSDEGTANGISSEKVSKKIKFDEPDVFLNELSSEKTELTLNNYLLQQYEAIPSVSAYKAPSARGSSSDQFTKLAVEPIVIEDRESSREDSVIVSCWSSNMPENSNKKKNVVEERKEKFIEVTTTTVFF